MKIFFQLLLLLPLSLLFQACGSEDDILAVESCTDGVQNGTETGVDCGGDCGLCGPPTSGNFFYALVEDVETLSTGSNAVGGGFCSDYYVNGGAFITDFSTLSPDAGVSLVKYMAEGPGPDEWYAMFVEGDYSYGSCDDNIQGAEVKWMDDNNVTWFSTLGDQTGSTFTITERGPQSDDEISSYCKGTFSCKVYNQEGDMKVIENGQFRINLGLF